MRKSNKKKELLSGSRDNYTDLYISYVALLIA